ncbi:MAG TPA: GNAT family N-acetyltransferase [candidate division Zixibacteria bacterium]|nr:GNAT family N-acetyltransferase [candidate division Zixibacteria bacterium]
MKIKQIKNYRDIRFLMKAYFKANQMTKEAQKIMGERIKNRLNEKDLIGFYISKNRKRLGFTLCYVDYSHIEEYMHHIRKTELENEVLIMLLEAAAEKAKELKRKIFQSFSVKNLHLKDTLEQKGFEVYPRARMSYNIPKNYQPKNDLDVCYKLSNFTPYRMDKIIDVIVKANQNHIDGDIFIQFSNHDNLKNFISRSLGDFSRLRKDSPIILYGDQIVGVNLVVMLDEQRAYIWDISVLSNHQRKGLGKALMYKAIENCILDNVSEIILDVTIDNYKAFNFYNKHGYSELNRYLTVLKRFTH